MKAYINTKCKSNNPDQLGGYHSYLTVEVPVRETGTIPQKGQTLSGYGRATPTFYMVHYSGRWQRVKAICFSNCATLYIGKAYSECLTVTIERE